jgi:hypothetical protein
MITASAASSLPSGDGAVGRRRHGRVGEQRRTGQRHGLGRGGVFGEERGDLFSLGGRQPADDFVGLRKILRTVGADHVK